MHYKKVSSWKTLKGLNLSLGKKVGHVWPNRHKLQPYSLGIGGYVIHQGNIMKKWFFLIALMTLVGCKSGLDSYTYDNVKGEPFNQWSWMLGKWYGEKELSYGGKHKWLVERFTNGKYVIHFKSHRADGSVNEKVESGIWGVSGNVYFSVYQAEIRDNNVYPVNPSDPSNYDAYYISVLNENTFTYTHSRTEDTFTVKKVANDFAL